MADWIFENLLPLALGALLPIVATLLRAGAKALRAYVKSTPTKADDQIGNAAGNALNGAADALDPEDD